MPWYLYSHTQALTPSTAFLHSLDHWKLKGGRLQLLIIGQGYPFVSSCLCKAHPLKRHDSRIGKRVSQKTRIRR